MGVSQVAPWIDPRGVLKRQLGSNIEDSVDEAKKVCLAIVQRRQQAQAAGTAQAQEAQQPAQQPALQVQGSARGAAADHSADPAAKTKSAAAKKESGQMVRHQGRSTGVATVAASSAGDTLALIAPRPIDCSLLVPEPPQDPVPVRSPVKVHSALARHFAGKDLVEIGTRNGDGMECFSRVTRSAVAIEMEAEYCASLAKRRARLRAAAEGTFEIVCKPYQEAHESLLNAEMISWWLGGDRLNIPVLLALEEMNRQSKLRPGATAVIAFDLRSGMDVESWQRLRPMANWSEIVPFDECEQCQRLLKKETAFTTCGRAQGTFVIAGFVVARLQHSYLRATKWPVHGSRREHAFDNYSKSCPTAH